MYHCLLVGLRTADERVPRLCLHVAWCTTTKALVVGWPTLAIPREPAASVELGHHAGAVWDDAPCKYIRV